jgi:hypothetical protein
MCAFMCFIPATIFLTISYFVLLTAQKAESARIKIFGKVVAVLLWGIAAMVIILGFYVTIAGKCPIDKLLTP